MSRRFTKIPASKPPPKKKLVRPVKKMSALVQGKSGSGFGQMGSNGR
jgi:hypothetical protein